MQNKKLFSFILLFSLGIFFGGASQASAANLNIVTSYVQTGGIKGALNVIGNEINGVDVCPLDPTNGCDFSADPEYDDNGTINDGTDDSYNGDLIIRTNDVFEVDAAWSWNGVEGGAEEAVTIVGTLPATGEYQWTDVPGSCDQGASSISGDGLTITCLRSDFTSNTTHAEDLFFTARVLGSAPNGATPGDISFEISGLNADTKTDDTNNTTLTVTAAPRWNLDKQIYTSYVGQQYNGVDGYIINYLFFIESDEVAGTTDDTPAPLGNESMGDNATFTFIDEIDQIAPNAELVDCNMNGRRDVQDGYAGVGNPITFNGAGSIYGDGNNTERKIPQEENVQQITCTQNGTDISVSVTGVDATLDNAPTHSYDGVELPVNRKIAAIGSINIFVPLTDVEAGPDEQIGTADDGELGTTNKLRGFDPTTPAGNSNFGNDSEALDDNDYTFTLYGMSGSFSKYYRGEKDGIWTYPGGAVTARSGDGLVTQEYEFSTILVNNNTGGTAYTENMCDVVDAYRLDIQDIEDNTQYNTIKTTYGGAYRDNTSPVMAQIWNGSGDYDNGQAQAPYEFEYSSQYVDNSWLPSRGGDQTVDHKTEVEAECNQVTGWHTTADAARADAAGIGAVTKIRIKLRNGVEHIPGAYTYIWLNHKVRTNDLLSGQPLVNGDEITNYAAYSYNGDPFIGPVYIPNQYPDATSGASGDRVTFSGGKVRIEKTADVSATAPGQTVEFTLASTYTNDTGTSETGNVIIRDVMPEGIDYVAGSVTGASEPVIGVCADVDASLVCDDNDNQVLIWDLGVVNTQDSIDNIIFDAVVSSSAPAGTVTNLSTIATPSDASAITQRQSSVGLTISISPTLNIVKSTADVGLRERTTGGQDIDYRIDMRNGKPGLLTDLDVIDILPFMGDGVVGALQFSSVTVERNPGTNYHGTNEFVSMQLVQHAQSPALCDVSANGGVEYYYTTEDPTTINLAPSVGAPNVIGGAGSIWQAGTANTPPAGMAKADVTAIRAFGPSMTADAICQLQVKMHVNNNLADDVYNNSAGSSVIGVTLPVLSNSKAVTIIGSSLGNKVWIDTDVDGVQDVGEVGLENVTVHLLDAAGNAVNNPTTGQPYIIQTNGQGEYLFEGLLHGDYKVKFDVPANYFVSPKDNGDDTTDSDANIATGETDIVTLGVAEENLTVDVGIYQKVGLGDRVWYDTNADGMQDAGEQGVNDVVIKLLDAQGDPVDNPNNPGNPYEVMTDAQGNYLFENLLPGEYMIEVVPPAGNMISPKDSGADDAIDSDIDPTTFRSAPVTLIQGDSNTTLDVGLYQAASLGDMVWRDDNRDGVQDEWEVGIAEVIVELLDAQGDPVDNPNNPGNPYEVMTDAQGNYLFENLLPGEYKVRFSEPTDYKVTSQNSGSDDVKDSDVDPTTSMTNMVALSSGENNTSVDAGMYALYANVFDPPSARKTVSDSGKNEIEWKMVWINDGNKVANAVQILDDVPVGTTYVSGSIHCDARGNSTTSTCVYDTAENRVRWEGSIDADENGTTEENSSHEVVITYRTTVPSDMDSVDNQARAYWDANGDGIFSDDVTRGQAGVSSDDPGTTTAIDPTAWVRTVLATGTGSIGDNVWFDEDGNGEWDDEDYGLEDIRVKLRWAGGDGIFGTDDDQIWKTETDEHGQYMFYDLPVGVYRVSVNEDDVDGYVQTYDPGNNLNNQDTITLDDDEDYMKADFGYSDEEKELSKTGSNTPLWLLVGMVCGLIAIGTFMKKSKMHNA